MCGRRTGPPESASSSSTPAACSAAVVTQPVSRPVIRPATASRALQRLFAGPTQAELARGLRFVTSGATGFSRATIHHGVARVYLTGGCNSGGSAITVATEIMPTLRQFPSVQWVKIYDPPGDTEQPAGHIELHPGLPEAFHGEGS